MKGQGGRSGDRRHTLAMRRAGGIQFSVVWCQEVADDGKTVVVLDSGREGQRSRVDQVRGRALEERAWTNGGLRWDDTNNNAHSYPRPSAPPTNGRLDSIRSEEEAGKRTSLRGAREWQESARRIPKGGRRPVQLAGVSTDMLMGLLEKTQKAAKEFLRWIQSRTI